MHSSLSTPIKSRWNRRDFIGVLKDECMPDWARERLRELQPSPLSNCGEAQHSGFAAKRRSNDAERMSELARTEQSVVCDDEGGMHMT